MKATTKQDYFERMAQVLHYIEQHIDKPITLEELAEVACFSPYHFHRIFRSWVGESLATYVRRLRVEQAASELTYSDKKITYIALDAGFTSPEAFNRAFKKRFDISPQQYRDVHFATPVVQELALETLKHRLFNLEESSMEVTIEMFELETVASVRHVGPYIEARVAWEKLCQWAGPKGFLEDGKVMGFCWDDPEVSEADKIRFDAAVIVPKETTVADGIVLQEVLGGEYAVTIHKGPLETLPNTYRQLFAQWFPGSGRELKNAPCVEKYLNNPMEVSPEDIRVAVCVPLS